MKCTTKEINMGLVQWLSISLLCLSYLLGKSSNPCICSLLPVLLFGQSNNILFIVELSSLLQPLESVLICGKPIKLIKKLIKWRITKWNYML